MERLNTLDKEAIETLVGALERHPEIIRLDRAKLVDTLEQAYVPETSRFHEILPENWQHLKETGRYHNFSIRRILRNRNAQAYRPSPLKWAYAKTIALFGGYSSDDKTRRIRMNEDLIGMMRENSNPFSLLAKLETYDWENPDGIVYIVTRPVLAIPDATDMEKILDWERANKTVEEEAGILFRLSGRARRIDPQEYLAH